MIVRVAIFVAILMAAVIALNCVGLWRGRSRADEFMQHVDGSWRRTQTQFTLRGWQFYYEAQEPEFKRSAPILIHANIVGNLPKCIYISYRKGPPAPNTSTIPFGAVPVSRDEAYALPSPFWNQPYAFSLKSTRPEKEP